MTKTAIAERHPDLLDQNAHAAPAPKLPATAKARARGQAVAAPATYDNLMQVLVHAASSKDVDAAKIRSLWEIHKEVEAERARLTFIRAFHEMSKRLPIINKDGRIEIREKDSAGGRTGRLQQATPFATFDAIDDAISPLLHEHGFSIWFSTDAGPDGRLLVKGHLDHIDGHTRETVFPLPAETSGSKNNVQGYGSSMSYGKRYAVIALLKIRSKAKIDQDDDAKAAGVGERLSDKQLKTLQAALAARSVEDERVFRFLDKSKGLVIDSLADVPASYFDEILSLIKQAN